MNKDITKLFSCTHGNRVIVIETNFKSFHKKLKNVVPDCYSDRWYIDKFKLETEFNQTINDELYTFQRLI